MSPAEMAKTIKMLFVMFTCGGPRKQIWGSDPSIRRDTFGGQYFSMPRLARS